MNAVLQFPSVSASLGPLPNRVPLWTSTNGKWAIWTVQDARTSLVVENVDTVQMYVFTTHRTPEDVAIPAYVAREARIQLRRLLRGGVRA